MRVRHYPGEGGRERERERKGERDGDKRLDSECRYNAYWPGRGVFTDGPGPNESGWVGIKQCLIPLQAFPQTKDE